MNKIIRPNFWGLPMNVGYTTFLWHEPNWTFMGCAGEVFFKTQDPALKKYHGALASYWDDIAQCL